MTSPDNCPPDIVKSPSIDALPSRVPPANSNGAVTDNELSIVTFAPAMRTGPGPSNWLPSPDGKPFSLTFRTYVPKELVKQGGWFPPSIRKLQ
jgi:hypothetical protein